jgi:3'-5' exoribonuclease
VKDRYVADLQPNEAVTAYFLVQSKDVRLKKSGDPYLSLILSDRTGQLEAKMWDDIGDIVDTFERDDFVKVQGLVQLYRDRPQITIRRMRRIDESEIQIADYLPHTEKNIEEMWAELLSEVQGIENPHLKQLLENFLADEQVASRLKVAPAAKTMHHAFIGGLLEHVISLLHLARLVASNYEFIDLDLLKTGVVLHDLGKIDELTYHRTFGYSDEGQLLGHIVMVLRMLDRKCAELPDFPPKLKTLIEHMILSHHGQYAFGSPKLPSFPEALLLHYIDDLDSKLENMRATEAADTMGDDNWTRFSPSLERRLFRKDRFLSEEPDRPAASSDGAPHRADGGAAPAAPQGSLHRRAPAEPRSLFGEKLQNAIQSDKDES